MNCNHLHSSMSHMPSITHHKVIYIQSLCVTMRESTLEVNGGVVLILKSNYLQANSWAGGSLRAIT